MFTAALFATAKMQKISRWINKERVVYTHKKWYLALRQKEILPYVTTQINLEDTTLNAVSLS